MQPSSFQKLLFKRQMSWRRKIGKEEEEWMKRPLHCTLFFFLCPFCCRCCCLQDIRQDGSRQTEQTFFLSSLFLGICCIMGKGKEKERCTSTQKGKRVSTCIRGHCLLSLRRRRTEHLFCHQCVGSVGLADNNNSKKAHQKDALHFGS